MLADESNMKSIIRSRGDPLKGSGGAVLLVRAIRIAAHLSASIPVDLSVRINGTRVAEAVGGKGRSDEETQGGNADDLHLVFGMCEARVREVIVEE